MRWRGRKGEGKNLHQNPLCKVFMYLNSNATTHKLNRTYNNMSPGVTERTVLLVSDRANLHMHHNTSEAHVKKKQW